MFKKEAFQQEPMRSGELPNKIEQLCLAVTAAQCKGAFKHAGYMLNYDNRLEDYMYIMKINFWISTYFFFFFFL